MSASYAPIAVGTGNKVVVNCQSAAGVHLATSGALPDVTATAQPEATRLNLSIA
jgi:hypothetical protein